MGTILHDLLSQRVSGKKMSEKQMLMAIVLGYHGKPKTTAKEIHDTFGLSIGFADSQSAQLAPHGIAMRDNESQVIHLQDKGLALAEYFSRAKSALETVVELENTLKATRTREEALKLVVEDFREKAKATPQQKRAKKTAKKGKL